MPGETPRKALVLGSGAIKIAEAAEFDYSGSQALKALREEGIETVLVNPNVATIQTSTTIADHVYLGPVEGWYLEKVIEAERPDAILIGFGGQTALSAGVWLHDHGVLDKYGVKVLGTPIWGVKTALSRSLFRKTMHENSLPVPPSVPVRSVSQALEAAEEIGYPVISRVSFNLGGGGSFIAWNRRQLEEWITRAFAQSEIREVLVEKYLHHWKEIEFEVVRDAEGNTAAVACLENLDPMGVHTGDSFVVAPCQTLSDWEYQELRRASLRVAEAIGMVGEGNVQLALDPVDRRTFYIIEVNPRMSRSSALASKATGYPLAYIAAKLALGYRLHELTNTITGKTCACFEPSLDYIVVKAPRWDLEKFPGSVRSLDSEMKSIGEAMAIGRNLKEALQKSIRMIDIGEPGLAGHYYLSDEPLEAVMERLRRREPYWPLHAAKAFRLGATVEEVYEASGVDPFFLKQIRDIVDIAEALRREGLRPELVARAKLAGFSDEGIALLTDSSVESVEEAREKAGVRAYSKNIDTLAGEWEAETSYRYLTYNAFADDPVKRQPGKILVIGAGVFRIGVSVEFDWAVVEYVKQARRLGYNPIVVNYNPETVSTDWDFSTALYFDEIGVEPIEAITSIEGVEGIVAFLGGQLSNNIADRLEERGLPLVGTPGRSVRKAEDRGILHSLLDKAGVDQPPWRVVETPEEALEAAREIGYPVIARPSFILSGTRITVAYTERELLESLEAIRRVKGRRGSIVVSKYIDGYEVDMDAVGDGRNLVAVVMQHIEGPGVHSGDSTMVLPHYDLKEESIEAMLNAARIVNEELEVKGPFNIQFIVDGEGRVYVIEVNLRSSRSMPFASKVTGHNLMEYAVRASLKGGLGVEGVKLLKPTYWGVKSPQFSWNRLKGVYPVLGPEMRSTGEVAALGRSMNEALLVSWLSVKGNRLPGEGSTLLFYDPTGRHTGVLAEAAGLLEARGYRIATLEEAPIPGYPAIPQRDAVGMLRDGSIGLVATTGGRPEVDYKVRRAAVDYGAPVILDHRLAAALARAVVEVDPYSVKPLKLGDYKPLAGVPGARLS